MATLWPESPRPSISCKEKILAASTRLRQRSSPNTAFQPLAPRFPFAGAALHARRRPRRPARQLLALGAGHLLQLAFAHRFRHLPRGAAQFRFRLLAALGGERGAGGLLLLLGFGWHGKDSSVCEETM